MSRDRKADDSDGESIKAFFITYGSDERMMEAVSERLGKKLESLFGAYDLGSIDDLEERVVMMLGEDSQADLDDICGDQPNI